jgi:hypothetical protein
MKLHRFGIAGGTLLLVIAAAMGGESPPVAPPPRHPPLGELIRRLGSEYYHEREAATRQLEALELAEPPESLLGSVW